MTERGGGLLRPRRREHIDGDAVFERAWKLGFEAVSPLDDGGD